MATAGFVARAPSAASTGARLPDRALRWSARSLVAIVWLSSAIFGCYILALYIGAVAAGSLADWNDGFPGLCAANAEAATVGIGLHFAFGAMLLILGPVQLIGTVRARWPGFHRWTGRVYAGAAFVTGLGGMTYIALRGTIGGPLMSVAFALYGGLLAIAAEETVRHAMARRLVRHRTWAIRLFALAIGSWLYRMDYGFWRLLTHSIGHTEHFDGWFDKIMVFWFFVPNLLVAEVFIRDQRGLAGPVAKTAAAAAMTVASLCLLLATAMVALLGWGPAILWRLGLLAS